MKYILKEKQYKKLINLISEQEPNAEEIVSKATATGDLQVAKYGDISTVAGSEKDVELGKTVSGKKITLYDKNNKVVGNYSLQSIQKLDNDQVEINLSATSSPFKVTTDCKRVPADISLDYSGGKYYSKELADIAAETCKTK